MEEAIPTKVESGLARNVKEDIMIMNVGEGTTVATGNDMTIQPNSHSDIKTVHQAYQEK